MPASLVQRTDVLLRPDPTRVVTRLFLPGQEMMTSGPSRATAVLDRVLALTDEQVERALTQAVEEFGARHRDLTGTFDERFRLIAHRLVDPASLSEQRRLLTGAYFSLEYAVESAALFNPSMVDHPDQSSLPAGTTRFVMSVRAVGEGHISSIEFRTGTIDRTNHLSFEGPSKPLVQAVPSPSTYSRAQFLHQLGQRSADATDAALYVLEELPETFDRQALDRALTNLRGQRLTRGPGRRARERLESIADSQYTIEFPADSHLSERVIMPGGPAESDGERP